MIRLLCGEERRAGLLDDLLVLALDGAVTHTRSPDVAEVVGNDLYLDVARIGDQSFDEDDGVAERPLGLTLGALEREFEFVLGPHLADAAATATTAGLDDERIADRLRVATCVGAGGDGSTTPRRDRDLHLLREELGLHLVTEQTHRFSGRTDEGDTQLFAHLDESGILGHEAPAHPHGVGLALAQGAGQLGVVEVGRSALDCAQAHTFVGLAHEHRAALRLGVQCNCRDAVVVLGIQFTHGSNQADRSLAAIDNRYSLEHQLALRFRKTH